jgi:hypothetical protein
MCKSPTGPSSVEKVEVIFGHSMVEEEVVVLVVEAFVVLWLCWEFVVFGLLDSLCASWLGCVGWSFSVCRLKSGSDYYECRNWLRIF